MLETAIAARCGVFGLRTPGASVRITDGPRVSIDMGERLRFTPFGQSGPSVGQRRVALPVVLVPLAKAAHWETTVRKQHDNYMTRVIATGDGTAGPPRWRVPV